ncbi:right-handed parallel beta-helix repeat-containing protein [Candidatus Woesearchaeota archaeon]|nr:right-handed parallel beta-helix repeat-containing protein [Candidatus Woesearchaeota archaeon]
MDKPIGKLSRKAQHSVEILILIGFVALFIVFLLFSYTDIKSAFGKSSLEASAKDLASQLNRVSDSGSDTKYKLSINLPKNLERVSYENGHLVFETDSGEIVAYPVNGPVVGEVPRRGSAEVVYLDNAHGGYVCIYPPGKYQECCIDLTCEMNSITCTVGSYNDNDCDGLPDWYDGDDDNDGTPYGFDSDDNNASVNDTSFYETDSDGDGIEDWLDTDDDGDGVPDSSIDIGDDDSDDIPNWYENDADNDSIPTGFDSDDSDAAIGHDDLDGNSIADWIEIDQDRDGSYDWFDIDDDGDSVPDELDSNPFNPNHGLEDDNSNNIPDWQEIDSDGDGIPDWYDIDDDNDGVVDALDASPLDSQNGAETDGYSAGNDSIADWLEWDTDGDGLQDWYDIDDDNDGVIDEYDLNPLSDVIGAEDSNQNGIPDWLDNSGDNNGQSSWYDFDADGVSDWYDSDNDNDGVPDIYDSNPFNNAIGAEDNDGNGIPDWQELDTDGDGLVDYIDDDDDNDGVPDTFDALSTNSSVGNEDYDGNGIPDWQEFDTDGDLIPDYVDPDDDNDGLLDSVDPNPQDATVNTASGTQEEAPQEISLYGCGTIDKAGVYALQNNVTATGDCWIIAAHNVTLKGNGYTVEGDGTGSPVVSEGYSDLLIMGFNISTFSALIINQSSNIVVYQNIFSDLGSSGIEVWYSDDISLINNTIKDSIAFVFSDTIVFSNNILGDQNLNFFELFSTTNSNLLSNNLLNSTIYLFNNSNNNIVSSNTFDIDSTSVSYGISISGSDNNQITSNTLIKEITPIFENYGIELTIYIPGGTEYSEDNVISNNYIEGFKTGISLHYDDDTLIYQNTLVPEESGFGLSGSNSTIYNNLVNETEDSYFVDPSNMGFNTTSSQSTRNLLGNYGYGGNVWAKQDGTGFSDTCLDADYNGYCDSSYLVNDTEYDYHPLSILDKTQILTCTDLQNMEDDLTDDYVLIDDIDCSATSTWNYNSTTSSYMGFKPIGSSSIMFNGTLYGQLFTITGLYINRTHINDVALLGYIENSTIENLSLIDIEIYGSNRTSGLVGTASKSNILFVSSEGAVIALDYTGGLIGNLYQSNLNYSSSKVTVTGLNWVGGLSGYSNVGKINSSYALGDVSGASYVGGLVGVSGGGSASIYNSYSKGAVSGSSSGGLVGLAGGSIISSYYDTETSGKSDTGRGEPKTTAEMYNISTFSSWDFTNVWDPIYDDSGYPKLKWQSVGISTCQSIITSGSYYLSQDISSIGDCISIESNNVYLTGNGMSITGDGTGGGINSSWHQYVYLSGLTISNFRDGINLYNIDHSIITNSSINGSSNAGIYGHSLDNFTIANNTLYANQKGFDGGTAIATSSITNNTVIYNSNTGIYVSSNSNANNIIEYNNVSHNGNNGIYLWGGQNNTIQHNFVRNNTNYAGIAFVYTNPYQNILYNNTVCGTTGSAGIYCTNSPGQSDLGNTYDNQSGCSDWLGASVGSCS